MCELQFIKRINGNLTNKDVGELIKMLQFGSLRNPDAFGIYNNKVFFKNAGIVDLQNFDVGVFQKSNFAIGHNRYKTTGLAEDNNNNHPFVLNDFVLSHNGIIYNDDQLKTNFNIKSDTDTDSYVILWLIDHYFNKSQKQYRRDKIIEAIKKANKKIEGTLSVFLLDALTKDIYYFKNDCTSFYFMEFNKSVLIGSTNKTKFKYLYLNSGFLKKFRTEREPISIKDDTIYLINDEVILRELGTFKNKEESNKKFYGYGGGTFDKSTLEKWTGWDDNPQYREIKKEDLTAQIDQTLFDYMGYIPEYRFNSGKDGIIVEKGYFDFYNIFKDDLTRTSKGDYFLDLKKFLIATC